MAGVDRKLAEGAFIGTFGFFDLGYEGLDQDGDGKMRGREILMADALLRWRKGHVRDRG